MSLDAFGKIHVYTGDGKGKTTAALGMAIRACGRGKKVAIVYFDKGGFNYGERAVLDKLADNVSYYVTGRDRRINNTGQFDYKIQAADKQEAERGLKIAADLFLEPRLDLLILDEINQVIGLKMLELEEFLKVLDNKPKKLELVLTGLNAHPRILERADLVTEMKLVKHYFYQGTGAREGIEY